MSSVNQAVSVSGFVKNVKFVGMDMEASLTEFIDNSLDADAKNIVATLNQTAEVSHIDFVDDGCGMTKEGLNNAFKLSRHRNAEEIATNHGRFGMGMKQGLIWLNDFLERQSTVTLSLSSHIEPDIGERLYEDEDPNSLWQVLGNWCEIARTDDST